MAGNEGYKAPSLTQPDDGQSVIPDDLDAYAANGGGPKPGASFEAGNVNPTPADDLSPYGTHEAMANGDHSTAVNAAQRGEANDHTRATAAGRPPRGRGDKAPAPFETVPGLGASDIDKAGRDGGLPDPVFRQGSGTTQRP